MDKFKQYCAPVLLGVLLTGLLSMATIRADLPVLAPKPVDQASDQVFAPAQALDYSLERTSALAFIEPDALLVANAQRDEIWVYQFGGPSPRQRSVIKLGEYKDAVAPVADAGPAALLPTSGGLIIAEGASHRLSRIPCGANRIEALATRFGTRRLNNPNSVVLGPGGDVYFTDSPETPLDALSQAGPHFGGIYRLTPASDLSLFSSELNGPVAIAYSNANHCLYVANGDPRQSLLLAIPLDAEGNIRPSSVFADLTALNGRWPGRLGPPAHGSTR